MANSDIPISVHAIALHRRDTIIARNTLSNAGNDGTLNHWKLAKRVDKNPNTIHPYRSGTWQFLSAALHLEPGKVNTVQDDMESFFWIALYCILRYMRHTRLGATQQIMKYIFDDYQDYHEDSAVPPLRGGYAKRAVIQHMEYIGPEFAVEDNRPLTYLISTLRLHWNEWYSELLANQVRIWNAIGLLDISEEEAEELHPFDPQNLIMFKYDAMLEVFEAALAMESWPTGREDVAFMMDGIPKKPAEIWQAIDDDAEDGGSWNTNF